MILTSKEIASSVRSCSKRSTISFSSPDRKQRTLWTPHGSLSVLGTNIFCLFLIGFRHWHTIFNGQVLIQRWVECGKQSEVHCLRTYRQWSVGLGPHCARRDNIPRSKCGHGGHQISPLPSNLACLFNHRRILVSLPQSAGSYRVWIETKARVCPSSGNVQNVSFVFLFFFIIRCFLKKMGPRATIGNIGLIRPNGNIFDVWGNSHIPWSLLGHLLKWLHLNL